MKNFLFFIIFLMLAACSGTPAPVLVVPTLAALPTQTDTAAPPTETPSQIPTWTLTFTATLSPTSTLTETPLPPTGTPEPSATPVPSETSTSPPTQTFTPSLTITNTITPTPSQTFTPMPELDGLGMLALLIERATVLPPELMYNPPTLTAVAHAAETLIAGGGALSPTPVSGTPVFGTLPPINVNCLVPPPASLVAADSTLTQSVGCTQGQSYSTASAVQSFERGSMLYLQGSPNYIYVLTLDGRFRRYDDTWVSGVDPEAGGETPPLGLLEPRRGFGKVWRSNLDARGALGWGINEEQGAASPVQLFERGRAVFLPQRGETYLLSDDPGGQSGTWRTIPASF